MAALYNRLEGFVVDVVEAIDQVCVHVFYVCPCHISLPSFHKISGSATSCR